MINKVSADYIEETDSKQFIDPKKLSELEGKINESVKTVMNVSPDESGNVDISDKIKMIVDGKNTNIEPKKASEPLTAYPLGVSTMFVKADGGYPNRGTVLTTRVDEDGGFQLLTLPASNTTYIRKYSLLYSEWFDWVLIVDDFGNVKSDAIDSDSSKTIATSKAVSDVNKKAVEALSKAEEAFLSGIDIKGKVIGAINSRGIGKPIPEDSSWDEVITKAKEKGSSLKVTSERCNQYKSDFNSWTGSNLSRFSVRAGIDSNTAIAVAVQNDKIITSMSDYILVTIYLGHSVTPFNNAMVLSMRIRGNSTSVSTEILKEGKGLEDGNLPIHNSFSLASGNEYADKEYFKIFRVQR